MGTILLQQAGRAYRLILSNKGLRVEHEGQEILRHWPEDQQEGGEESATEDEPQPGGEEEPQPEGEGILDQGGDSPPPVLSYNSARLNGGQIYIDGLSMPAKCVVFRGTITSDEVLFLWNKNDPSILVKQDVVRGQNRIEFTWLPGEVISIAFVAVVAGKTLVSEIARFTSQ